MNRVHFSSKRDRWSTPQDLFDALDAEFHFRLDVCADEDNAKVRPYYSPEMNGLKQWWHGPAFMNPPYSQIAKWVQKAYRSTLHGVTTVALLPARTDTRWFFGYVLRAHEIRFLKGRLRFGAAEHVAPFPSLIAVFRPGYHEEPKVRFVS